MALPGGVTPEQSGTFGAGPILCSVMALQMLDRVETWFALRGPMGLSQATSALVLLLPCLAGAIPCGWLAGWLGQRRALVALLLAWSAVSLGMAAPLPAPLPLLIRIVAGMVQAGLLPIAVAMTLSVTAQAGRAMALSLVMIPASAGPALVVALMSTAGFPGRGSGIRLGFVFIGLGCLMLAREVWQSVADMPGDGRRQGWAGMAGRRMDVDVFLLAGLMAVEAGLTLSAAAAAIWTIELCRDIGFQPGPSLAVIAAIGVVMLVLWSSRVDRQGRWGAALVTACALATMGYAAGTLKGSLLQKFAGLAAQAAGVAVGRSMIRGLAAPLAQGRLGVARLAAIDMAGLTAVAATPRFVEWLSDAGENLQFGLLAIILVLMATTLVASLLTFTQD